MKTTLRSIFIGILLACTSLVSAQQVNTLYFLENAPMRHTINPAFQPVSKFYLTLPVVGYTSLWAGTNGWAMSDFIFKAPDGNTITPWHPDANTMDWLAKQPKTFAFDMDLHTNILGFGFRIMENSYLHINVSERISAGVNFSSSIFGINHIRDGVVLDSVALGVNALAYTEFAVGFSHNITRQWSVGGKIKVLVGHADARVNIDNMAFNTSLDSLHMTGNGTAHLAAPLNWSALPTDPQELADYDVNELFSNYEGDIMKQIGEGFKPAGMGVTFDLGVTYKPIKNLQISAAVTDLGFIRWHRYASATVDVDATFKGIDLDYSDYGSVDHFDDDLLVDDVMNELEGYIDEVKVDSISKGFPYINMLTANLNVGIDANFWKNRVGVGVYSHTRFHNSYITEEVTFGAALRPVNWFNLAASYSFINGHWSNLGAAISLATYDGIMFTLAADYIPLSYAKTTYNDKTLSMPYKSNQLNLSVGVTIVTGTNKPRKKSKAEETCVSSAFFP